MKEQKKTKEIYQNGRKAVRSKEKKKKTSDQLEKMGRK